MIKVLQEDANSLLLYLTVKEANLANADSFKIELITLLDKYRKRVIIDLKEVEYIDSSFLGALVSALKHAISAQSDIILVGLKKDIADLFALIRLDKVFKIYDSFNDVPDH